MKPRRWPLPAVIALVLLAGCSKSSPTDHAAQAPPQAQASRPNETLGSAGVDLAGIDRSVQPGDDFFSYANGNWLRTTEIPADRSRITTFQLVNDKAEQRTADLIRDL